MRQRACFCLQLSRATEPIIIQCDGKTERARESTAYILDIAFFFSVSSCDARITHTRTLPHTTTLVQLLTRKSTHEKARTTVLYTEAIEGHQTKTEATTGQLTVPGTIPHDGQKVEETSDDPIYSASYGLAEQIHVYIT